MHIFKSGLFILLTLSLISCATLNKDECLTADWASLGFEDGAQGKPAHRIGEHREACAKHGVTPDLQAYNQGRDEGLQEYCRPGNGYEVGVQGASYQGVCPTRLEDVFLEAYEDGRHLYQLEHTVAQRRSDIVAMDNRIHRLEQKIQNTGNLLINGDTTAEERQSLVNRTKNLSEELGQLEAETRNYEVMLGREEYELALYRRTHVNIY